MTAPTATIAAKSTRYTATASAAVRSSLIAACTEFIASIADGAMVEVSVGERELQLRVTAPVAAKAKDGHP